MHRLQSDEVFHFYLGDPVEMLQLCSDGSGRRAILGSDVVAGEWPQMVVPPGCTVSPGFEYEDYESGGREELTRGWPEWRDWIAALTHE